MALTPKQYAQRRNTPAYRRRRREERARKLLEAGEASAARFCLLNLEDAKDNSPPNNNLPDASVERFLRLDLE
jgi:hypothetical protein